MGRDLMLSYSTRYYHIQKIFCTVPVSTTNLGTSLNLWFSNQPKVDCMNPGLNLYLSAGATERRYRAEVLFYLREKVSCILMCSTTTTMTARVIIIHDPASNIPSDNVACDAINSEINDKVVVRVIGRSGCRVTGCRVPGVPSYTKYNKCRKQTWLNAGVRGDIATATTTPIEYQNVMEIHRVVGSPRVLL